MTLVRLVGLSAGYDQPAVTVQGEEEDVSSSREEEDDENSHRKFIRRNMPLYLPRIIIPRQGSLG